jgi:hypothetical protein
MITRTYSELFELIQALCGVIFANIEKPRIHSLVNRRTQKAYRSSKFWPSYLVVGQKTSRYQVLTQEMFAGQSYKISANPNNFNFQAYGASSNDVGTVFEAIGSEDSLAAYGASLLSDMGYLINGQLPWLDGTNTSNSYYVDTVIKVHREQPYLIQSAQEFDFYISNGKINVISAPLDPEYVWITYQSQLLNYYDEDGEFPVDNEWFEYIAHGVYADYLRAEGQQERAALADQEADAILQDELIRLDEQRTTGLIGTRINTNSNMQIRW